MFASKKMRLIDHILDHMLDHMIISLVITTLYSLGQRRLCQQGKKPSTRPILFNSMEEIPQKRKYLGTIIYSSALKKTNQFFTQKTPREANRDFSTYWFYSANG